MVNRSKNSLKILNENNNGKLDRLNFINYHSLRSTFFLFLSSFTIQRPHSDFSNFDTITTSISLLIP